MAAIPLEAQSASLLLIGREDGSSAVPTALGGALRKSSPTAVLLLAEARRFQKDVADGTTVTVPVGHVALSAEE